MNQLAMFGSALLLLLSLIVNDHYPPWRSAHAEFLSLFAVAALAVGSLRASRLERGVAAPVLFLALLASVPLLQAAVGKVVYFGDAWVATAYLLAAACAAQASWLAAARDEDRWTDTLAATLLAGAALNGGVAMVQRWSVDLGGFGLFVMGLQPGRPPWGNLGQPNHLAELLFLGMAGALALYERRRIGGGAAALAAVFLTFCAVLTHSRTPLLLFGAALMWHLALAARLRLRTPRWFIVALAAGWFGMFLAWPSVLEAMDIANKFTVESRARAGPRTVIWSQLLEALWLQPWTGWGWNQVSVAQMAVAQGTADSRMSEFSHNLLLDLALWNGVVLAAAIVGLAGWWLVRAARRVRTSAGAFGLLVLLLLLTHSMVEFPLAYLYFLVPCGFALGLVMRDGAEPVVLRAPRGAGTFGAAAVVILTVAAAVDYWRVEEAFREMRFTFARIGRPMVAEAPPMLSTQFTQLAAQHHNWLSTARPGMSEQEIAAARDVSRRYGYAPILYRYALVQAMNGDVDGARVTMQRLCNLHAASFCDAAKAEIRQLAASDHPELRALLH